MKRLKTGKSQDRKDLPERSGSRVIGCKGLEDAVFGKVIVRWTNGQPEGTTVKGNAPKVRVRKTSVSLTGHNNSNLALCRLRFITVKWELFVKSGSHFCFMHLGKGQVKGSCSKLPRQEDLFLKKVI